MARLEQLEAELEVVKLEEKLKDAKKGEKTEGKAYRDLKVKLREARQAYREQRAAEAPGDGDVRPDAVDTTARKN